MECLYEPAASTRPGFQNNQRAPQKSNLKRLLEFKNQTGFLNGILINSSSKVDFIFTHNKMLETQISQLSQQVASFSRSFRIFSGQPEPNLKAQMNVVTLRNGKKI